MTLRRRSAFARSPLNVRPRFSTASSHVNGGRITWRSLMASSKSDAVRWAPFDSWSTWATWSTPGLLGCGWVSALPSDLSPFSRLYDWVDWVDWVDHESCFGPPGPPSLLWM